MTVHSELLRGLPTAVISDALDRLGLPGSLRGIGPVTPGAAITGPAFTVAYEPVGAESGTVGDFLDDVPAGSVVLIDNAGRTDCTVWGGIMTSVAAARGVAGTVIHGSCRDVATTLELTYPVWSTARFMRTGKDRVRLRAVESTLQIGGVTVSPGDLVCGDADGVVVVPATRAGEVAEHARAIDDAEREIVATVRSGHTLRAARERTGYHRLQRHRS